METQRCNGQKSRQSKLLSHVQKQLQKYNIRDRMTGGFPFWVTTKIKAFKVIKMHSQKLQVKSGHYCNTSILLDKRSCSILETAFIVVSANQSGNT